MNTTAPHILYLVDGHHGVHVPQAFAQIHRQDSDLSSDDMAVLNSGPDNGDYWEVWDYTLDNVRYFDRDAGRHYELRQTEDGDLLGIGVTVSVMLDKYPENPRVWDNVGTMYCEHGRYTLGDEDADDPSFERCNVCHAPLDECEHDEGTYVSLSSDVVLHFALSLYDHSGLSIRHGAPSDPWDSGYVGIHYVTKDAVREHHPYMDPDNLTDRDKALLTCVLESELEVYNHFLRGNCWGFEVETLEKEPTDFGCWGFIGDLDEVLPSMKEHLDESLHFLLEEAAENPDF